MKEHLPSHDRLDDQGNVPDELRLIDQFTDLLDAKFRIPGTNIRFGLDPILGLIPFAGEAVTFCISSMLILAMVRHGVSGKVAAKMLLNIAVDALTGFIPVVGDLVDVYYKANRRNYELLRQHQVEGKHQGSAWPVVIGVAVSLLLMAGIFFWGLFSLSKWVIGLFG